MKVILQAQIRDITRDGKYEKYLYRCLAPMPYRKYSRRQEYLEKAIPKGFHKKLLILDGNIVGQIEYAPAGASGYPISGDNVIVMNCLWVLRKAKGHALGKKLFKDMTESEGGADGFATIALENHWSPWFVKWQMEKLGFKAIDSTEVAHKTKHKEQIFSIYLMWMPITKNAKLPSWDKEKLLEGETFCLAHPLYRSQTCEENVFEQK